jgi:hypothetical protein
MPLLATRLVATAPGGHDHAQIETGPRPGSTALGQPRALRFVGGLVLSGGLEMSPPITVACTARGTASAESVTVDEAASVADAHAEAADLAVETDALLVVRFK